MNEWGWCSGGVELKGENRSKLARKNACLSAALCTTNLTWTALGLNPSLRGERPVTDSLIRGTDTERLY